MTPDNAARFAALPAETQADIATVFGVPVDEQSDSPWPPTDAEELAALDRWCDELEALAAAGEPW